MTPREQSRQEPPGNEAGRGHPRFSVVIPACNEVGFLGNCLDSLLGQEYSGRYEIIVVDNNSTDGTADLARSRGVRVVHEPQRGVCWARQCGTQAATGEIVVSSDADTTHPSDWLARIDKTFGDDESRVAVAGPCRFVDAPWWGHFYTGALFGLVDLIARITGRTMYVTATNIAFRRSAWTGYDTRATQGGDELGLLRRLRTRGKVAFDRRNPVFTSSRRLYRGLAYNVAVTFFFYYALGYALNRVTGRPLVGMAPHFRVAQRPVPQRRRKVQGLVRASVCLAVFVIVSDLTVHLVDWW